MDKVQIINDGKGRPAFAVVPWDQYEKLKAGVSEDAQLIAAGNAARGDETFPADVAARLVAGEPALKVLREWRGMTQTELGEKAEVAEQYISQIERRQRNMGKKVAARLAPALGVSVESLNL